MPAFDGDFRAVGRIPERINRFRREVRQRAAGRTIHRARPKIIHRFFPHDVGHRFSVRQECVSTESPLVIFDIGFFLLLDRIKRQHQLVIGIAHFVLHDGFPVRRECVRTSGGIDDRFRKPPFEENPLQIAVIATIHVVDPFPVERTFRIRFVQSERELLEVGPRRIDTPQIGGHPAHTTELTEHDVLPTAAGSGLVRRMSHV